MEITADIRTVVKIMGLAPWTHVVVKRKKPFHALGGGLVDSVVRRFGSLPVESCIISDNVLFIFIREDW